MLPDQRARNMLVANPTGRQPRQTTSSGLLRGCTLAQEKRQRGLLTAASLESSPAEEQLRTELCRKLPPGGGGVRPPSRQEAADQTSSVRVTVDARGEVLDVDISRGWRNRLTAEGFAEAVFEAYTAAREQAIEAAALAMLAADDAGEDPARPTGRAPGPAAERSPGSPEDLTEWLVWVRDHFGRIRAEAEQVARVTAGVTNHREHTGPHGRLTATLEGYGVVGIVGDAAAIWYADTEHLREDAIDIFSAAHRPAGG